MRNFLQKPFELFKRERQINQDIQQALAEADHISETKANLVYFFMLANVMLLAMNLFIYFALFVVLITTPFYPLSALFRLLPPLLFLPFLRLFQTRWIPKVRKVHMEKIGFDVDPIVKKYSA